QGSTPRDPFGACTDQDENAGLNATFATTSNPDEHRHSSLSSSPHDPDEGKRRRTSCCRIDHTDVRRITARKVRLTFLGFLRQAGRVSAAVRPESLATVLGGRRGALDASIPPVAFVLGWLVSGNSIGWGAAAAITVAVLLGVVRLVRGQRVAAVVVSLTAVVAAALIALYTGRAQD